MQSIIASAVHERLGQLVKVARECPNRDMMIFVSGQITELCYLVSIDPKQFLSEKGIEILGI